MNRLDSIINRRVKKKHLKNGEALSWRRALVSIYVWKREREKKEIFFFKCKVFILMSILCMFMLQPYSKKLLKSNPSGEFDCNWIVFIHF